jgi:putative hydrolase of the HAD superfamily
VAGPLQFAAVFLDFGGVLGLPAHEAVQAALAQVRVSIEPALLDRAHYAGMAALDDSPWDESHAWVDYMIAYTTALRVPTAQRAEAVAALMAARSPWSRVLTDSVEALHELAATRVSLGIVSNSEGTLEARLRSAGICQVGAGLGVAVDAVIDSTVVGVRKPDPQIFDWALQATRSTASGALHVGDSVRYDVAGARAAGILPLHFDPFDFCQDPRHEDIRSLRELRARL